MLSPIQRRKIRGKVRECSLVKHNTELIVWWYGGILKNTRANSVPNVIVFFRELDAQNIPRRFITRKINVTNLGLLRIGSIWRDGICRAEAVFQTKEFNVDFTTSEWQYVSPWQRYPYKNNLLINEKDYPLKFSFDKNWLIDFKLDSKNNLLIPSLEFYTRCYGSSAKVRRVLSTYQWGDAIRKLYSPIELPVTANQWPVRLGKSMRNDDVIFLAHVLYDSFAERAARNVYAQIESEFKNPKTPIFIKVGPWFQEVAKFKVKGLMINNGQTFLGLQILGYSDPLGVPIHRTRANTNNVANPVDPDIASQAREGLPHRVLNKSPAIINLTDDNVPDHGTSKVDIEEPEIEKLGIPRLIIDIKKDQAESIRRSSGGIVDISMFSPGEAYGNGKGVGYASIYAQAVMESEGVLRDMWNSLRKIMQLHPDKIQAVEWFTFKDGFNNRNEPSLISLQPFDEKNDTGIKQSVRNWIYYDVKTNKLRGIFVIRITSNGKYYYIVEIQRTIQKRKDKKNHSYNDKEESYSGLIFTLYDNKQLEKWLRIFLLKIRSVKGIVYHLTAECPGIAKTFAHRRSKGEKMACENAVKNALKKFEINL